MGSKCVSSKCKRKKKGKKRKEERNWEYLQNVCNFKIMIYEKIIKNNINKQQTQIEIIIIQAMKGKEKKL